MGNRGTMAEARLVICGVMLSRTKRRSAEIVACTVKLVPVAKFWFCGMKVNWPLAGLDVDVRHEELLIGYL